MFMNANLMMIAKLCSRKKHFKMIFLFGAFKQAPDLSENAKQLQWNAIT